MFNLNVYFIALLISCLLFKRWVFLEVLLLPKYTEGAKKYTNFKKGKKLLEL